MGNGSDELDFGSVLTVAVDQSDDVEAIVDRILESDLLVPAVPLVHWIHENREVERNVAAALAHLASFEGSVLGGVVDDQDLGVVELTKGRGNAGETRSIVVSALYATMNTSSFGLESVFTALPGRATVAWRGAAHSA